MNFRVGGLLAAVGLLHSAPPKIVSFLLAIVPLSLVYLGALGIVRREGREKERTLVGGILLFALLFRLPLLLQPPNVLSSDLYRYLWDGRVQVQGSLNPYLYAPEDSRLTALRDTKIYPNVNRKPDHTIYPPGAQILFRLASAAGADTPATFKILGLGADLLSFLLLLLILRELRLPAGRVVIYAWNPLVIYELAYSGHLEAFVIPCILGFLYFFLRGRPAAAGTALGAAVSLKLVPVLLLAAVPAGRRRRVILPLLLTVSAAYLAYAGAGSKILGFLPSYLSSPYEIFNPGLLQEGFFSLARTFSLPLFWSRYILLPALLLVLGFLALASTGKTGVVWKSSTALGAYLVLIYPAFHPWYLCPLIALLCLVPSGAWICFSLLLPLSYLKYLSADGMMPDWVTWAEFVPLYALLAAEYFLLGPGKRRLFPAGGRPEGGGKPFAGSPSRFGSAAARLFPRFSVGSSEGMIRSDAGDSANGRPGGGPEGGC